MKEFVKMPDRILLQKCSSCKWLIRGTRLELDAHETTCIRSKLNLLRGSQESPTPESSISNNITPGPVSFSEESATTNTNDIEKIEQLENPEIDETGLSDQQDDDVDISDWNQYERISKITEQSTLYPQESSISLHDSTNLIEKISSISTSPHGSIDIPSNNCTTTINGSTHVTSAATVIDVRQKYIHDDEHIKVSLDMYAIAIHHGGTQELFDKMITRFNQYINKQLPPLYSYSKSRQALRESYGVKPKQYHICKNGCMMFKDGNNGLECDVCHEPRYQDADTLTPNKTMTQLSLKEQLALFVNDDTMRTLLKHRAQWTSTDKVKKSVFDGAVYKELLSNNIFQGEMDIALALYVDDFEAFKRGTNSMSICHVVILNLPEDVRYEDANMIQIYVAPGPKKPKDIFSFLDPVLRELDELCTHGMIVETDEKRIPLKAHLLFVGGDIPGVAKVAGHMGHQSYYGCRFCTIKGMYQENRMTFPPVSKSKPQQHVTISTSSQEQHHNNKEDNREKPVIRRIETFKRKNESIGQIDASPFANLCTFHGATFFPIDIMHLMKGIGEQLWKMIKGVYGKDGCSLYLSNVEQKQIGSRIASSRHLTPSSFAGDCGDISFQSGFYRAVDWIHFMLYFVPTTVLEFYVDVETRKALTDISIIYQYAFSREIDENGMTCLRSAVKSWTNWLCKQVNSKKLSAAAFTINEHYLTHLCKTIERDGPLVYLAAFNMERSIGAIKTRVRSHRHPGINAGNMLLDLAAVRKRKRNELNYDSNDDDINENSKDKTDQHPLRKKTKSKKVIIVSNDKKSSEIWGPFAVETMEALDCRKQLRHFWAWRKQTYSGVNLDPDEMIETGNRLYKDGITYGGTERESLLRLHIWVDIDKSRKRSSVKPEQRQYFGQVKFFFKHGFVVDEDEGKCEKLLAFVELCRLVKGHGPWPYKTDASSKIYVVIEEDNIIGFAGRTKGKDTREYIYWSQKTPHSLKDITIDYNLEYIPR